MFFLAFLSGIYFFYMFLTVLFRNSEKQIEEKFVTIVQNTHTNEENKKIIKGPINENILTELGKKQAGEISELLNKFGSFDAVYCSPSVNTLQTAVSVLEEPELIIDNDLLDINQGDWIGKEKEECYTDEVLRKIEEDRENFRAPNGESMHDLERRITDLLFDVSEMKEDNIIVFTHETPMKLIIRWINDYEWSDMERIRIPDEGIIRFRRVGDELELCEEEEDNDSPQQEEVEEEEENNTESINEGENEEQEQEKEVRA